MGTKQVQVSGELWQQICTVGWRGTFECIKGLPEGAVFRGISHKRGGSFNPNIIVFIFEHPDWPEVEPGEDAPVVSVVWKRTYDG